MKYLSAIEAARRIGVNEKTVRLWVQSGKLTAIKPARNRLAIPESEVEQKAREYQLLNAEQSPGTSTAALVARIASLEATVEALVNRIEQIESRGATMTVEPSVLNTAYGEMGKTPRRRTATVEPNRALPPGCTLIRDFANQHGVNPATFRDHITVGIGRGMENKDRVEASERPKPGRANEIERYLTPEQQRAALAFWDRHGVPYTVPGNEQRADNASSELQGITEKASSALVGPEKPVKSMTLYEVADQHKMNRNEVVRRFNMGMIRGKRQGRLDSSIVLSADGMHDFWLQFHDEPGFYTCDNCPHS